MNTNINIAVLIIFFVRPEKLQQVFEKVKIARPSKIYLYQDGPRDNNSSDVINIEKCRNIVENIDWPCKVEKFYQKKNIGCDPSEYIAIKWMFEKEDMGIILEDDDVPSVSFFKFCKELLEKYRYDNRIYSISGMNHFREYNSNYADYIFTTNQSIWGWATWKRSVDLWDSRLKYLNDSYVLKALSNKFKGMKDTEKTCRFHLYSNKEYYESISWEAQNTNNMLNIVPTKNQISNIGIGENATHGAQSIKELPIRIRNIFYMPTYEITFPIRHPKYVIDDKIYLKKFQKLSGQGDIIAKYSIRIEGMIRGYLFASRKEKLNKIKRLMINLKKYIEL